MPFPGTQQIQLAFSGGLQSKVAKYSLDQPNLEDAENCTTTLAGQVQKRAGFTALSRNIQGGGVISAGSAIQVFGDELVVFDGRRLYTWDPDESVWINKGTAYSLEAGQVRILNTKIATQYVPDASVAGGLSFYVWFDNRTTPGASGIRYSVLDNATGAFVVSDALLWANGGSPKVIPWQSTSFSDSWLVAYEISATSIYANTAQASRANLISAPFPLAIDGLAVVPNTQTIPYDLSSVTYGLANNQLVYFAYQSATGLKLKILSPNLGSAPTVVASCVVTTNAVYCVSVYSAAAQVVWVVWSEAGATRAQAFNGVCASVAGPFVIQPLPSQNIAVTASYPFTGPISVTCEIASPSGGNYLLSYVVNQAGFTYVGQQRGLGLASKAFVHGEDVYVNAVWPSALQATYFTLCLTSPIGSTPNTVTGLIGAASFEVVSKYGNGNAGGYRTNPPLAECLPYTGADSFLFAGQRKGAFTSYAGATGSVLGVSGYTATFATSNAFNSVSSNNNLHITGGVKKIYDGASLVEDNFHVFPELLSLPAGATFPAAPGAGSSTNPVFSGQGCSVVLTAGTGLTASSQYQYIVVYEWPDNFGQVQRSGPSVPTIVQTGAGSPLQATLTIPTLRFTDKMSERAPVSIAVYRTQANLPIFYKITNDDAPLVNDPTVDFVTFVDSAVDGPPVNFANAGISSNENLYTSEQLGNTAPPSCSLISLFQNRLVVNESDDPNVAWYSQNKFDLSQYNTLPIDWNTSFVEGIDSRGGGGAVSALGLLDASLAIYRPTSIYILQGSGPNALDTSGEFSDAQLLVSDVGCTNQNSLVFVTQTPKSSGGLLFKSAKGIYLLGRDTSLTYVGAPVEEYNNLTITSANLLAMTNEIVFGTSEGTLLVYNYFFDTWSTWTGLPSVDAVVWKNELVLLREDGTAMVQGTGWQDTFAAAPSAPIVRAIDRVVRTPWIKLDGQLQGYMAVYNALILGQFQGPSILQVDVAYDYNPSIVESTLINSSLAGPRWGGLPVWGYPAGTWGGAQFSNYQFQVNFKNPRCQSIQLTLTDRTPEASAGSTLNGISLEVLRLPGGMRVPASNIVRTSGYSK